MKPSEILLGLIRIPVDFLMGLLAFYLAYELRFYPHLIPGVTQNIDLATFPNLSDYLSFSMTLVALLILIFAVGKMYSFKYRYGIGVQTGKIIMYATAGLGLLITWFFLKRAFPFSRLVLIYAWVLSIIFITLGRILLNLIEKILYQFKIGQKHILFIGNNPVTIKLVGFMRKNRRYNILEIMDENNLGSLEGIIKKHHIDQIIQTESNLAHNKSEEILGLCRENQIEYSFVPDLLTVQQTNIQIVPVAGIPLIELKPTPLDGWGRVVKRTFDLIASLCGIIILSPFLAITAIAIKLDDWRATIIFKYLDDGTRVKRVGQNGKLFNFYKFRTMKPNTHNLRYTLLAEQNLRKDSPLVKIKDDPRVTKVGKFLRKTSIDELPQLFNVLIGHMSLVGPRPHLPEEVAKYKRHHKFVLTSKPGITGMAQISGRSDLDFEEEIRLDSYYIENWSLWLDIKIILKTLGALLNGYSE